MLKPNTKSSIESHPGTTKTIKPPIAPKPKIDYKLNDDRKYRDPRLTGNLKLVPLPPPRSKKINIPSTTDLSETLTNTAAIRTNLTPNKLNTVKSQFLVSGRNGGLPPLPSQISSKNVISIGQSSVSNNVLGSSRNSSRASVGNAKNALLMEKVRLNTPVKDEKLSSILNEASNSNSTIAKTLPITINSSCIVPINCNNNDDNNSNNNNIAPVSNNNNVNESQTESLVVSKDKTCKPLNQHNSVPTTISSYKSHSSNMVSSLSSATSSIPKSLNMNYYTGSPNIGVSRRFPKKDQEDPAKSIKKRIDHGKILENYDDSNSLDNNSIISTNSLLNINDNHKRHVNESEDEVDHIKKQVQIKFPSNGTNLGASLSAPCSPAKPILQKSDAVDLEDYDYYKKLSRGISKATDNVNIVSKARTEFAQEIWEAMDSDRSPFFVDTPIFTFTLPDLSIYSDEFRMFLERDLIEMSTLVSLESACRLNWWAMIGALQRLWPLATSGDGNCLLHAASLGMWGFHDRLLTLRKALYEFLTRSQYSQPLWRRWRWQVSQQNRETGLVYNAEEWEAEWANVIRLASSAPRGTKNSEENTGSVPNLSSTSSKRLSNGFISGHSDDEQLGGHVYESLEEIHVLALAHVLRRPIIVVADITLKVT